MLIVLALGSGVPPPVPVLGAGFGTLNVTFVLLSSIVNCFVTGAPTAAPFSKAFKRPPVYTLPEKKFLSVGNSEITVNLISVSVIVAVAICSPFGASNGKSVIGRLPNIEPMFVDSVTVSPTFIAFCAKV